MPAHARGISALESGGAYLNLSILFGKLTYGLLLSLAESDHLKRKISISMDTTKKMNFSIFADLFWADLLRRRFVSSEPVMKSFYHIFLKN
jgi:hypothetical protein